MATLYGVTVADVKGKLPVDSSAIPATGGRLSEADLTAYITDASALVTGWVQRAGRDAASLEPDALRTLAVAIEAWAAAQALLKLGHGEQGSKYQAFRRRWEAEEKKWATSPQLVAGAPGLADDNLPDGANGSPWVRSRFTGW